MNTKFSNRSAEERKALENLSKRRYIQYIIVADKGGALYVSWTDLNQKEALGSFLTPLFMLKSIKISLPLTNKSGVTIKDLIVKLPATVTYLFITSPRVFTFYLKFINRLGLNLLYSAYTIIQLVQLHFDYCRLVGVIVAKHYLNGYKKYKTVLHK